jgi:hypothetical protein
MILDKTGDCDVLLIRINTGVEVERWRSAKYEAFGRRKSCA